MLYGQQRFLHKHEHAPGMASTLTTWRGELVTLHLTLGRLVHLYSQVFTAFHMFWTTQKGVSWLVFPGFSLFLGLRFIQSNYPDRCFFSDIKDFVHDASKTVRKWSLQLCITLQTFFGDFSLSIFQSGDAKFIKHVLKTSRVQAWATTRQTRLHASHTSANACADPSTHQWTMS